MAGRREASKIEEAKHEDGSTKLQKARSCVAVTVLLLLLFRVRVRFCSVSNAEHQRIRYETSKWISRGWDVLSFEFIGAGAKGPRGDEVKRDVTQSSSVPYAQTLDIDNRDE